MSNNSIEIFLTSRFKKDLSQLAKRYRAIRKDLEPLVEQLKSGEVLGDQISGLNIQVFKVRLKNSNIQKGKSAGYRVIYYVKTEVSVVLVTIYSKSDTSDIQNVERENDVIRIISARKATRKEREYYEN